MAEPRSPNLMSPIPGRAVASFPTPVISDQIITEYVSAESGAYTPLPYGTLFDSVSHGAFTNSYPDFQLVYEAPADVNGWFYKRIWVNNRIDQQTYNYDISYAEGDPEYPTITRVYVYPRDSYNTDPVGPNGPLTPLTPDPVYPGALLVQEQMLNQAEPVEIQSRYVKVVRVYETLPGPVVTTQDFDTELNALVYTDKQVVLATNTFNPASNLLTLEMRESPRNKYTKLRLTSYLQSLPATRVEYQTGTYNWPTLVFDITLTKVQLTTDPDRSEVYWYPDMRTAPNVPAILKTTTSFSTSSPSPATLYTIPWRDLLYRGISFQIAINNVLNDAITVSASFTDDERYGNLSESHTFAATSPTATAYQALIGTYQNIGSQIDQWRGSIWVTTTTQVLLV